MPGGGVRFGNALIHDRSHEADRWLADVADDRQLRKLSEPMDRNIGLDEVGVLGFPSPPRARIASATAARLPFAVATTRTSPSEAVTPCSSAARIPAGVPPRSAADATSTRCGVELRGAFRRRRRRRSSVCSDGCDDGGPTAPVGSAGAARTMAISTARARYGDTSAVPSRPIGGNGRRLRSWHLGGDGPGWACWGWSLPRSDNRSHQGLFRLRHAGRSGTRRQRGGSV